MRNDHIGCIDFLIYVVPELTAFCDQFQPAKDGVT